MRCWRPGNAAHSFASTLVDTIVLEIPHDHPRLRPGARIGVWAATKLATDAGGWRQLAGSNQLFDVPVWYERLPTSSPETWLLRIGWERHGKIDALAEPGTVEG